MMRYFYCMNVFLFTSIKSYILPSSLRIVGSLSLRPFETFGKVNQRHNLAVGNGDRRSNSFWSIHSSLPRRNFNNDKHDNVFDSASAYFFRQEKTWKRLSHLLHMSIDDNDELEKTIISPAARMRTVADIGTDHGLLAMGLALSGNYKKVCGVDVSRQALTRGALAMLKNFQNQTKLLDKNLCPELPLEFRVGNGLETLEFGEADIICIAGMGVNTMLQILEQESSTNTDSTLLENIGCRRLVLQATNSKPRNLILLYDRLQKMRWKVCDERIEKVSSRWYITTRFELSDDPCHAIRSDGQIAQLDLPGLILCSFDNASSMRKLFDEYYLHHKQWITKDAKVWGQQIDPRDLRWLEYFDKKMTNSDS